MLFTITFTMPGDPDRNLTITDQSLVAGANSLIAKASELFQPTVLRKTLSHAEPFLPALAEAAGAGIAGQVGVQIATTVARRALDTAATETLNQPDPPGPRPNALAAPVQHAVRERAA